MEKVGFSGFVKFFKEKLKKGVGFILVFLRNQRLEFFYRLFEVSFDIKVMSAPLFVFTKRFDGISTMRQRKTPFLFC